MATNINLGAKIDVSTTGTDKVQSQIDSLEKELTAMGDAGDASMKKWLSRMIDMAKVCKQIVGNLERGIVASNRLSSSSSAGGGDLTASINKLDQTIANFAVAMQRQAALNGASSKGEIQDITGRPQNNAYQELSEIATREQGKQIRGQAIQIVNLLSQAENELEKKKADVRELVKGIKTKVDFSKVLEDYTLNAADMRTGDDTNVDIINDELLSSLQNKFNLEILSDTDQMFKIFDVGFNEAKKKAGDGMSLLKNAQGQWINESVQGQKLIADLAFKFYRSNMKSYDPQVGRLETASQKPDFNIQTDLVDKAGDSDEGKSLKEMVTLVQSLFSGYQDIEQIKRAINQIDEKGTSQASNNMQKLERMLALNRDQLALAKENNSVSVRYNTILQQNERLMGQAVGAMNTALIHGDFAEVAVLQRTYSNQIQKSVNLEKQLQQLIERNTNLQQGYLGQLNKSLQESTNQYFRMGTTIRDVTQAVIAQDAARAKSGGSPQFGGFVDSAKSAMSGLDDILTSIPGNSSRRLAESMLGPDFDAVFAHMLKESIGKAMNLASSDSTLATNLSGAMSDVANKLFEFATAADGTEGVSKETTASLLKMAEALRGSSLEAQKASAGVQQYSEGLKNAVHSQEAVRASSASVQRVLEQLRSQMRVGDESSRIMERVQRNAQRNAASTLEVLGEVDTVLVSLRQPMGLFDRETISNAKSFLTTLQSQSRAARENVEALKQAKNMALSSNSREADSAKRQLPSVFEGSADIDADAKKSADAISQYYDKLIAEGQNAAQEMSLAFNRSFSEINKGVKIGSAFSTIQDGMSGVQTKVNALADQYKRLSLASNKNSSDLVSNASAFKQLTQDISAASREVRLLESQAQELMNEMTALKNSDDPIDVENITTASKRYADLVKQIETAKQKTEDLMKIRNTTDYIATQSMSGTIDKTRQSSEKLTGQDFGDMRGQLSNITAGLQSKDVNQIASAVNEFKALKAAIQGTANEADKSIRSYQNLIDRGVQLDSVDRQYMQTLLGVKNQTSDLMIEMSKQEGAMKSAETRVKVNTQSFNDYAQSVYMGIKSQIDFAIGAGALTSAVAGIGMAFRELLSEARMLSRTLTVLQSDILTTEQVSRKAYDMSRELAVQYGMTISSVADVAKELGSAGMKLEEVNRAWEDTLRAINATNAETTQVTRAVAGIYNVYRQELIETGNEMNEVGVITDTVTSIFRNHQAEMDEIVQGYKFVVGTGKTAGFTFQEMGAYLSVLNDNMIKSGMAGRGLQTVFAQTAAKTDQLAKMFNIKLDPNKSIASQFNYMLEEMNKKIGTVEVSARDMNKIFQIFDREGARAFTTLVQQYPAVKKALHETTEAASGVTAEMNLLVNQSLDRRFFQMKQAILDIARQGFEKVQPHIISFLDSVKAIAKLIVNVNSAMGGVPIKFIAMALAMMTLMKVMKTIMALGFGAYSDLLSNGARNAGQGFLAMSSSGRKYLETQKLIAEQTELQTLLDKKALATATAKANGLDAPVQAITTATGQTITVDDASARVGVIQSQVEALNKGAMARLSDGFKNMRVSANNAFSSMSAGFLNMVETPNKGARSLEYMNTTAKGLAKTIGQALPKAFAIFKGAMHSAFNMVGPLILIALMARLGEEIGKSQNRIQNLRESIDKSTASAARLSSELFRMKEAGPALEKIARDIAFGFSDASNAGRKIRDIVNGLGADAQIQFADLSSLGDEEIGNDYIRMIDRVNDYTLSKSKETKAALIKDQRDTMDATMEMLMKTSTSGAKLMRGENMSMNLWKGMGEQFLRGVDEVNQKGKVTDGLIDIIGGAAGVIGGGVTLTIAGAVEEGLDRAFGDDTWLDRFSGKMIDASLGIDPEKVKDKQEAIKAILSGSQDVSKMTDEEKKKFKEQKQIFDTFIGDLKKVQSQLSNLGAANSQINSGFAVLFKNMQMTKDETNSLWKAIRRLDFTNLKIAELPEVDVFENTTKAIENMRSSMNWQMSSNQFTAYQDQILAAQFETADFKQTLEDLILLENVKMDAGPLAEITARLDASTVSAERLMTALGGVGGEMQLEMAPMAVTPILNNIAVQASGIEDYKRLLDFEKTAGIDIDIPLKIKEGEKLSKEEQDAFEAHIRGKLEELAIIARNIEENTVTVEVKSVMDLIGAANYGDGRGTEEAKKTAARSMATGQINVDTGRQAVNQNNFKFDGLAENAFRLAEINSLLKKQNELNGINNKLNGNLVTTLGAIKGNHVVMSKLTPKQQEELKKAAALQGNSAKNEKERLRVIKEITNEMIRRTTFEGKDKDITDEQRKAQEEALELLLKTGKEHNDNSKDRLAKQREIKIQIEQENNALRNQMQLLGKSLVFIEQGAAASARDLMIQEDGVNAKIRELIVSRQLLGVSKDATKSQKKGFEEQRAGISNINDLYMAVTRNNGLMFKSGKESAKGYTELAQASIALLEKQRKYTDDFAEDNKLLIETIGVTESIISGSDDTMWGKASQQIYAMLARLPEIDLIEKKILYVLQNQNELREAGVSATQTQADADSQIIRLYAKKAKLLQEMQKAQKDITKSLKEQLVDDKRPELYQSAAEALQGYQTPLEKESNDRLKGLFDKDALSTAMGMQSTSGDPLLFMLQNREDAMKRFMIAAKEGQVDFSRLSSTIQHTLGPQLEAYKLMIQYEDKLKASYVDRARKVSGNLTSQIAEGDFSKANTSFATLQSSILDLTKKTGNELLTVKASEELIKINTEMLHAEQFQKDMLTRKLDRLNFSMERVGELFVAEAEKIQRILASQFGDDWANVKAALDGGLEVRTDETEASRTKLLTENNDQLTKLNIVLLAFAKQMKMDTTGLFKSSQEVEQTSAMDAAKNKIGTANNLATNRSDAVAMGNKAKTPAQTAIANLDEEEKALAKSRAESAKRIQAMTDNLTNWADGIKGTRIQAEAYAEALKIVRNDESKAAETIQQIGEAQRKMWRESSGFWKALGIIVTENMADVMSSVSGAIFSTVSQLGNIDYAVQNAETYKTLLEAIKQATESYIGSVDGATTALKRNESGYYDYINSIQEAEKARYDELIAAEKEYRENLKQTEQIFKDNFIKPIKDSAAELLSTSMSSIADKGKAMFSEGMNQLSFGLAGMAIESDPAQQLITATKENTKAHIEQTKALTGGGAVNTAKSAVAGALGIDPTESMSEAMKGYLENSPTMMAWNEDKKKQEATEKKDPADNTSTLRDEGGLFSGETVKGFMGAAQGLAVTAISGVVSAFGSVIGMAFDATMEGQTEHLMKFIERFATQLPDMITGFIEKFGEFFPKLVETLVQDVLPAAVTALAEGLPAMLSTILTTFADNLGPFVTTIIQGFKEVIGPLLKTVIKGVVELIPSLMGIFGELMDVMPTLILEGIGALISNLPKIFVGAVMVLVSALLTPIEWILGIIRSIGSFFGMDTKGMSIMKYVAKATKSLMDAAPTFHTGGTVPGTGEKRAVLLGGEGVLNRRAMNLLGSDGLNQLNKGYSPLVTSYEPLGATEMSRMTPNPSMPIERSYGASSSVRNDVGINIVVNGNADRKVMQEVSADLIDQIDAKLAKKQANRSSRMNRP